MKTVSAAEANRHFSRILREVAGGETVRVTSHGRTVARILPASDDDEAILTEDGKRRAAKDRLLARLNSQAFESGEPWTRSELYENQDYPETF